MNRKVSEKAKEKQDQIINIRWIIEMQDNLMDSLFFFVSARL